MRTGRAAAVGWIALLVASDAALAQHATPHISGYAHTVDGATLRIGDLTIRLAGLQAPALDARLSDRDGRVYPAGLFSRDALAALIADQIVGCRTLSAPNDPSAMVAVCASPVAPDIGLALLKRGWATLATQDGKPEVPGYAPVETEARHHRRGLWQNGDPSPLARR